MIDVLNDFTVSECNGFSLVQKCQVAEVIIEYVAQYGKKRILFDALRTI